MDGNSPNGENPYDDYYEIVIVAFVPKRRLGTGVLCLQMKVAKTTKPTKIRLFAERRKVVV